MEHWQNTSLENLTEVIDEILYVEEWEPIKGYEGSYEISTFGRVKSFFKWNGKDVIILRQSKLRGGYVGVYLRSNKIAKCYPVHRLVAINFINNPENKPTVNHKWGKIKDNRVSQLEWATLSEQMIHSMRVLKRKVNDNFTGKFGKDSYVSKKVMCINNGIIYDSARHAETELKISHECISNICRGKAKASRKGLIFKFM